MKVFVDSRSWMPRRNVAAAFLVASLGIATNNVNPPAAALTATVNPPAIFNGNINLAQTNASPVFAERVTYQPVNRGAKYYLAASQSSPAGPALSIPTPSLQLSLFAPQVLQATPILHGQDLQYNKDYREDWHLPRRNYAFLLNQGPTLNVNVLPLNLAAFAPTVTSSGSISIPLMSLNLAAFAPVISQANSGLVQVPLLQLSLNAIAPDLFVTGSLLVSPPALTLSFQPVVIKQGYVDGQAKLPNIPYISGIGPWDITLRTYG